MLIITSHFCPDYTEVLEDLHIITIIISYFDRPFTFVYTTLIKINCLIESFIT